MRDSLIDPEPVTGPHITPQSRAPRYIDQAHDGFAVDRCRNRLTEFQISKPRLLTGNFVELLPTEVVQVEQQGVVFQAGPHIRQLRTDAAFLTPEQVVILRAWLADDIGLTCLEAQLLRVLGSHDP